jgi:hypothetical protein
MPIASEIKVRRRISTLLFVVLTSIAGLVLLGLVVMTVRLVEIQDDLGALRDSALPRLVKLSQLSQEAAATISIAPALSAKRSGSWGHSSWTRKPRARSVETAIC